MQCSFQDVHCRKHLIVLTFEIQSVKRVKRQRASILKSLFKNFFFYYDIIDDFIFFLLLSFIC